MKKKTNKAPEAPGVAMEKYKSFMLGFTKIQENKRITVGKKISNGFGFGISGQRCSTASTVLYSTQCVNVFIQCRTFVLLWVQRKKKIFKSRKSSHGYRIDLKYCNTGCVFTTTTTVHVLQYHRMYQ